jgi:hypothetical protein
MLPQPSILDASSPAIPLIVESSSIVAPEVSGAISALSIPAFSMSDIVYPPAVIDASVISLPLMTTSVIYPGTVIISDFRQPGPIEKATINRNLIRPPNPYHPEEVRRAIQSNQEAAVSQSLQIALINTEISEVASEITLLNDRVSEVEAEEPEYLAITDSTVSSGQAVYMKSTGHIDLAVASSTPQTRVIGFSSSGVASGQQVEYNTDGRLSLSDWTAASGSTSLAPGAFYYLSNSSPGMITTSAPTSAGSYVVQVGIAVSSSTLDIEIKQSILL